MLGYFLFLYIVIFFVTAFFWRSYLVWRHTGINPYKLGSSDSAHDFIGWLFRWTNLAVIVFYTFSDTLYAYLTPISWLMQPTLMIIGLVFLLAALLWVLIAQVQMGDIYHTRSVRFWKPASSLWQNTPSV